MKSKRFDEVNIEVAKNQPQYETIFANIDYSQPMTLPVTACFELTEAEIEDIKRDGVLWLTQLTFGRNYMPILLSTIKPKMFVPPLKSEE